jgi:hypothetical protein
MKVQVVGSVEKDGDPSKLTEFQRVNRLIGAAVASERHQLVVLSDRPHHADISVLEGYAHSTRANKPSVLVSTGAPEDLQNFDVKLTKLRSRFPQLRFEMLNNARQYPFNRVAVIQEADVLLIIGGEAGSRMMAEIAFTLGKPILPILAFGGSAQSIWERLELVYKDRLPPKQLRAISSPRTSFDESDAKESVDAAGRLFSSDKARQNSLPLFTLGLVEAVCLIGWFAAREMGPAYLPQDIVVAILLFLCAIFGVFIRAAVRIFMDQRSILTVREFTVEIGLGVGLAFVFYLLYQLTANSVTDSSGELLASGESFRRGSVVISLLGFGVAYLLEDSIQKLRREIGRSLEASD